MQSVQVKTKASSDSLAAISTASVLLATVPFAIQHGSHLWNHRPHYAFFPALLVCALWLLWDRWQTRSESQLPSRWSSVLLLGALVAMIGSVVFFSPWLGAVAALMATGGVICHFAGKSRWQDLFPAWLLCWLVIPLPLRLDDRIVRWLQSATSRYSSNLLDIIGIRHLMEGNVLVLPGHRLLVEEACSGVNSQFVLIAFAAVLSVALRRPLLRALLLIISAFFWAGLVNVLRVVSIAVA